MIDCIRLRDKNILLPECFMVNPKPFEQFDLEFDTSKKKSILKGYTSYFEGYNFEGFNVRYFPYGLYLENSIHKFSNGNNYSDFRFTQMLSSIEKISNKFQSEARNFEVGEFEFAINTYSPIDITELLARSKICKLKEAKRMISSSGKVYGVMFEFRHYKLKIYNKTLQVEIQDKETIPDNILRVELVVKKKQAIFNCIKTLEDLKNRDNLILIFGKMISTLRKVTLLPSEKEIKKLSESDLEFLFAGYTSDYWEYLKHRSKNRHHYKRVLHKNLVASISDSDEIIARIIIALYTKFMYLLNY